MSQKQLFIDKGDNWEITPYGEFISYHHAHSQIINNLLDLQVASENEIKLQKQKAKQFLRKNIKKVDHFVEYTQDIANFVSMTEEEFNQYMIKHFLEVLQNTQDEMKKQFVENVEFEKKNAYFNSDIIQGILENIGEFSFAEKVFNIDSNRNLYIENLQNQEKTYSTSAAKFRETQTKKAISEVSQEKVRIEENPILEDILTNFGDILSGETLVLKRKKEQLPVEEEKDSSLISGFDDFDFEEDILEEDENITKEKEEDFTEELEHSESVITEVAEKEEGFVEKESTFEEKAPVDFSEDEFYEEEKLEHPKNVANKVVEKEEDSLNSSISELQKEFLEDEEIEQIESSRPNNNFFEETVIISFTEYIQLSNLNKKNKKLGIELYKKWLISLSKEQLGIIFIEDQLEKKILENEWDSVLKKISQQVGLSEEELDKIKQLVMFLFQLKKEVEMFLNLCKKDYPLTIPVFQKNWLLFLQIVNNNIGNQKVDFQKVENETLLLLDETNDSETTFKKIFQYWLENRLKKQFPVL